MIYLSSYQRLRRYVGQATLITDNNQNKRDLLVWLSIVSAQVEKYLNRTILSQSRTEYFDVGYVQKEFFPKAIPVSSITSVKSDSSGLYNGSEYSLGTTEYFIGAESRSVVLPYGVGWVAPKGLQLIYTGGLCSHAVNSVFAITATGTWVINNYCEGQTSGAVGILKAVSATSLTVEVLYGVFEVGETLHHHTSEDGSDSTSITAVLDSKTSTALCESYPDITGAVELQNRYMWQNKMLFESQSVGTDGKSMRSNNQQSIINILQPEAIALLDMYRRKI